MAEKKEGRFTKEQIQDEMDEVMSNLRDMMGKLYGYTYELNDVYRAKAAHIWSLDVLQAFIKGYEVMAHASNAFKEGMK